MLIGNPAPQYRRQGRRRPRTEGTAASCPAACAAEPRAVHWEAARPADAMGCQPAGQLGVASSPVAFAHRLSNHAVRRASRALLDPADTPQASRYSSPARHPSWTAAVGGTTKPQAALW